MDTQEQLDRIRAMQRADAAMLEAIVMALPDEARRYLLRAVQFRGHGLSGHALHSTSSEAFVEALAQRQAAWEEVVARHQPT